MLVPITEQVFVPVHRIERISLFGTTASIKYVDQREVERIEGPDAQRLMMWINRVMAVAAPTPEPEQKRRK
jgi:hypothetical protein